MDDGTAGCIYGGDRRTNRLDLSIYGFARSSCKTEGWFGFAVARIMATSVDLHNPPVRPLGMTDAASSLAFVPSPARWVRASARREPKEFREEIRQAKAAAT